MFQRFSVMAGIEKEVRQIFIGQLWLCLKNPYLDAFLYKSDFFIFLFHCFVFHDSYTVRTGGSNLSKFNDRNTRKRFKICSKLTRKTQEGRH